VRFFESDHHLTVRALDASCVQGSLSRTPTDESQLQHSLDSLGSRKLKPESEVRSNIIDVHRLFQPGVSGAVLTVALHAAGSGLLVVLGLA
jgi:hypothetical protein